jgi:diguanylate cyclase (GGDEF)-like protein
MDELTGQFLARLRERIASLAADRAALAHDAAARHRVRDTAHALKGSGGTYGFPDISAAAGAVESAEDAGLAERLDALLARLRDVAAGVAPTSAVVTPASPPAGAGDRPGILIVDDDPDVHRLLATVLGSSGLAVRVADSAAGAARALSERPAALIVLDLMLPDADGRSLLARLREDPRTSAIPIIVLSGHASARAQTECYALGVEAFIIKPFDPATVLAAVTATLERTGRRGYDARLDPVTMLPNRVAFREAFERAAASRPSGAAPTSIALLELDQYRALASSHGWGSADRALAAAAPLLTRALPGATIVARWTGGTCAALLAGVGEGAATTAVAGALRAAREAAPADGPASGITFSAGVAERAEGASLEETVAEAERQLAVARASGGDTARSAALPGPAARHLVVLAEDDELIATVVKHRLEREGVTVRHFADGAAAAAATPQLHPSLAILDVKMPAMDGFELLGRLRGERSLARMPIMMLTSMGSEQDVVRGLELGADDYMVKPFSPAELVARVHRLLSRA